jgi:cation transport ATPase
MRIPRAISTARVERFENIPGHGAVAQVDGHRVAVGNARLMDRQGIDFGTLKTRRRDGSHRRLYRRRRRGRRVDRNRGRASSHLGCDDPSLTSALAADDEMKRSSYDA